MYKSVVARSLRLPHQAEAALAAPAQEHRPRTDGLPQGEGTVASEGGGGREEELLIHLQPETS